MMVVGLSQNQPTQKMNQQVPLFAFIQANTGEPVFATTPGGAAGIGSMSTEGGSADTRATAGVFCLRVRGFGKGIPLLSGVGMVTSRQVLCQVAGRRFERRPAATL
jgi:hypothetical protein